MDCVLGGVELILKTFGFLFSVPVVISFCVCLAMSLFQKGVVSPTEVVIGAGWKQGGKVGVMFLFACSVYPPSEKVLLIAVSG